MCRIKTLNSLAELRSSGFGQPAPRHGLRLLYWFVENCVEVNQENQMILLCIPSTGDFGFRVFHNRAEGGKGHLLPDSSNLLYYELGNLSGAKTLPEYVREKYTGFQDKSNTDRILVGLESGTFHSIYVTRHETRINFDLRHTFCVGPELVRTIKKMQREDFLSAAKRRRNTGPQRDTKLLTEQKSELLTAHRAPSHQPYNWDLQLHAAPHLRHHPQRETRNISVIFLSLLFLLTTALLLGFI